MLFVVLALWMVPQAYMLSIGLRTPAQAFDPVLFAWPVTFDNFVTVIHDNPLAGIFLNSLIITVRHGRDRGRGRLALSPSPAPSCGCAARSSSMRRC